MHFQNKSKYNLNKRERKNKGDLIVASITYLRMSRTKFIQSSLKSGISYFYL